MQPLAAKVAQRLAAGLTSNCATRNLASEIPPGDARWARYVFSMKTLVLLLSLAAAACGAGISTYAVASAGRVGCPAENIEVINPHDDGKGPRSWVAACGGKRYACSTNGALDDDRTEVTCSEVGADAESH